MTLNFYIPCLSRLKCAMLRKKKEKKLCKMRKTKKNHDHNLTILVKFLIGCTRLRYAQGISAWIE